MDVQQIEAEKHKKRLSDVKEVLDRLVMANKQMGEAVEYAIEGNTYNAAVGGTRARLDVRLAIEALHELYAELAREGPVPM